MASYPQELEGEAVLRDGTAVSVRPVRADDDERLGRLYERLSPATRFRRFFTLSSQLSPPLLRYLAGVDYDRRLAVVATVDDEVVGVARYDRLPEGGEAEIAVLTEDAWQGRGVATVLLETLAGAARARGITTFVGTVLGENRPAVRLLRGLSAEARVELVDGQYRLHAPLDPTGA